MALVNEFDLFTILFFPPINLTAKITAMSTAYGGKLLEMSHLSNAVKNILQQNVTCSCNVLNMNKSHVELQDAARLSNSCLSVGLIDRITRRMTNAEAQRIEQNI